MNIQDYIAALTEASQHKDAKRLAATGPMRWTLGGVEYTSTGRFNWDQRREGWLIAGNVGLPATPEYQLVMIGIDTTDPYEVIDQELQQGHDKLGYFYSQSLSGGIWIQQPSGSVTFRIDLANKVLEGSFEAQVKIGNNPALVPLSGSFSLAA